LAQSRIWKISQAQHIHKYKTVLCIYLETPTTWPWERNRTTLSHL